MTTQQLLRRLADLEAQALERDDLEAMDTLSAAIDYVTAQEWHHARYWASIGAAMADYIERWQAMQAALSRAAS